MLKKLIIASVILGIGYSLGNGSMASVQKKIQKTLKEFHLLERAKKLQSKVSDSSKKEIKKTQVKAKAPTKKELVTVYSGDSKKFDPSTDARCTIINGNKKQMSLMCQGNLKQQRKLQRQIVQDYRGK